MKVLSPMKRLNSKRCCLFFMLDTVAGIRDWFNTENFENNNHIPSLINSHVGDSSIIE